MDEKEKCILDSATDHFVRYGYKKTSIDEIIKDAQVGKGTVYNYFKNKEELFKRVAEIEHEIMYNHLKDIIASEPDPEKRLILYVFEKIKYTRDYFSSRGSDPGILKELKESYEQLESGSTKELTIVAEIYETGIKSHTFEAEDKKQNILFISEIIRQFELKWANQKKQGAKSEITSLFKMLFNGIRV